MEAGIPNWMKQMRSPPLDNEIYTIRQRTDEVNHVLEMFPNLKREAAIEQMVLHSFAIFTTKQTTIHDRFAFLIKGVHCSKSFMVH